jgi:sn-glycerol 3-phosphate transport system permease protein
MKQAVPEPLRHAPDTGALPATLATPPAPSPPPGVAARHGRAAGFDLGRGGTVLDTIGAWVLGILWILPLLYAVWAAFHPPAYATRFDLLAPLTLENFQRAWEAAPFPRYFLNTFALVTMVLAAQLVLSTMAGYAFARFDFRGRDMLFMLVLLQLMVMPDVLIVENYRTMSWLGLRDTVFAIGLPYFASAFGIFLLRQTFKTIPRELEEAARVEGASGLQILMKVYVPLARPTYIAYGLVSVSHHWNNFLWPLIITNSVETRPLTVGLQVFSSTDQGIDWSVITAATLLSAAPLLIAFLLFQRQFVQSFLRAGIR